MNDLRHDFSIGTLDESSALQDPFAQFELWFSEALGNKVREPNAMVLSTATVDARPSSRVVLLRGFDSNGFIFYTNYDSRKAAEIEQNPQVSLLLFWAELEKQVRIEGTIAKASNDVSDAYFASRPRESQIGAWASPQSSVIADRSVLEDSYAKKLTEMNDKKTVDRPENWGGYIVVPDTFEFWQGRNSRLHDRLRYKLENNSWKIERLAP